jgi:hypothetical protein
MPAALHLTEAKEIYSRGRGFAVGDSQPAVHSVHVYNDEDGLMTRLCGIFGTSLRLGDSALIIATAEHRKKLVESLEEAGIDVRACAREGRYTMLDAEASLAVFMREGMPDPNLFDKSVANVLTKAKEHARSRHLGVTVFGEMVALLWNRGEKEGALKLEQLWNDTLRDSSFHLHCAYPRDVFGATSDLDAVHSMHTHVLQ